MAPGGGRSSVEELDFAERELAEAEALLAQIEKRVRVVDLENVSWSAPAARRTADRHAKESLASALLGIFLGLLAGLFIGSRLHGGG